MAVGVGARGGKQHPANMRWNFTVLGADIAFFSLGLSISSAYTVLPLFVHHLTSNNEAVALIPAVRALGLYGPPLLVAPWVERRRKALPFILKATVLERVPFLLLAICSIWLAHGNPGLLLGLFLLMIFLALLGSGITYPAWLDLIARTIPRDWMGRFLGLWTGLGGLLGIGGAAIAAALLANFAFPLNFALCFLLTFASYVVSFVLLALGREPPRDVAHSHLAASGTANPRPATVRHEMAAIYGVLRKDRGLLRLIGSNALAGVATMGGALFAVSALKVGGLSDAEVGIENTVLFVAMTGGNFLWGALGDAVGHRAVLVLGSLCAGVAALVAIAAHGFWPYALVFLLLGLTLSATQLAGLTFIAEFGPAARRPTYIALASVAYAPFAVGAPVAAGFIANAWGYVPVFVISAVTGIAAAGAFHFLVPNPRRRSV